MSKGKYLRKQKVTVGKKAGRILLVILLVLVILIGAVGAFVWSKLSKITYDDGSLKETIPVVETQGDVSTDPTSYTETVPVETEPVEGVDMEGLDMVVAPILSNGELFKDKDVMNILLVGSDEFTEGFVDTSRGDVNILVSMNRKEKTVKLVSFSRGIAIQMLDGPYKGKYDWLTNAHRWAGTSAVMQAFEENFKIECNRYVRVNFHSVIRIVDEIGGVELELTQQEASFMNDVLGLGHLKEGINQVDGTTACYYARLRGVDDDWYRMVRQRKAIMAVVNKLKDSDLATLNSLCDMVMPLIKTNLSTMEIVELMMYAPTFFKSEFDSMTIPIDNSYSGMTVMGGVGGWALNYEKNNAALHEFLFGAEKPDVG